MVRCVELVQQNGEKAYSHELFSNVKFETKLQDMKPSLNNNWSLIHKQDLKHRNSTTIY